jgi:ACS family sodium-dependent inorganic phosphate cotransporter
MLSLWIPKHELCKATAIFSTGSFIGTVIVDFVGPILIDCCGWPEVFYVFGMLPFVWLTPWVLFTSSSPTEHPFISREELYTIDPNFSEFDLSLQRYDVTAKGESLFASTADSSRRIWFVILRSPAAWALAAMAFAYGWGNYILMSFLPKYFNEHYGLSPTVSGWITSLSYLLLTFVSIAFGALIDWLKIVRPQWVHVKKICAGVGLLIPATIMPFLGLSSIPSHVGIGLAVTTTCFLGVALNGYASNQMELAPHHTGMMMGFTNTFGNIPGAIGVYLSGWILQITDNSWTAVFGVATAVLYTGTTIYLVFGSRKPIPDLLNLPVINS